MYNAVTFAVTLPPIAFAYRNRTSGNGYNKNRMFSASIFIAYDIAGFKSGERGCGAPCGNSFSIRFIAQLSCKAEALPTAVKVIAIILSNIV